MLASAGAQYDVAVIGAGAAGLATTGLLREKGLRVALLEAGTRLGGRAWTDHPAALGGARFDHGAQWLHVADRNPLIPLARSRGIAVQPDTPWEGRSLVMDSPGRAADREAYARAEQDWHDCVMSKLAGPDVSLAQAADPLAQDPWTATVEAWEGAIIAAGDADELSLRDWHANALEGENYVAPQGLGDLLVRLLGPGRDVHLASRVTRIDALSDGVRIHVGENTLRAGAAIVTVSTGVLRAEGIAFSPALPPEIISALDGLPMGLLSKIVLRASSQDRLGLWPGTGVFRRLEARGAPFLSTIFWADGSDLAVGFVGGRAAWSLAGKPAQSAEFMRQQLDLTLGPDISRALGASCLATDWGENPLFRGAYAYARPGHAQARTMLATPIWDGRLTFAGEACATDGLAGTVAGAYLNGRHVAENLLRAFPHPG